MPVTRSVPTARALLVFVAALGCCCAPTSRAFAAYTYTTLDVPGATDGTFAWGVSGGTVVGYYGSATGAHGFVYDDGTYTTLDDPAATNGTYATGVSGDTVVGYYQDASGYHCFIATAPEPSSLGLPAFALAGLLVGMRRRRTTRPGGHSGTPAPRA